MKKPFIFVITPIGKPGTPLYNKYDAIFKTMIKPAVHKVMPGFKIIRADQIAKSGSFVEDIIECLENADIVIANLTDLNPNVCYELGIRHAFTKRTTIMITEDIKSLPSDLRGYRTIEYKPKKSVKKFELNLSKCLREIGVSRNEHFIGIDIGAKKIDACLFDYKAFQDSTAKKTDKKVVLHPETIATPGNWNKILDKTAKIIEKLVKKAKRKHKIVHGIGIGLPGMVNPKTGTLVKSARLGLEKKVFVRQLEGSIKWGNLKGGIPRGDKTIPIKIDNDARCATRFFWKCSPERKNFVCVFIGNGLGSGIVVNGKMIYGEHFFAGEAGHTTISSPRRSQKCHCNQKGYHWEMHVCSHGIFDMLKEIKPEELKEFEDDYFEMHNTKYSKDCREAKRQSKRERLEFMNKVTEVMSDSYYKGKAYAFGKIVDKFFEDVAIGVANYVNILNPEEIILGGGMIRAFCDDEKETESSYFKESGIAGYQSRGHEKIAEKMKKYALREAGTDLILELNPEQYLASQGAALIFKDESYAEYFEKK